MTGKPSEEAPKASGHKAVTLGAYRLFAHLGTGGMADVFLALEQGAMNVNRLVVVKRLHKEQAQDETAREMFLDEARLAARLSHPNVVQTFEAGSSNGSYFLAMEYIDGQPLSRLLSRLKRESVQMEPRIAARIAADVASGLHYAHELRDFDDSALAIVHRDVSPQNIMIAYEGTVKLVDFGIAKAAFTAETAHGVFKGKVAFMAPEQVVGGLVDRRADVFALGIVLWESLTGQVLMAGATPAATLYNVVNMAIPSASSVNPKVPAELDRIIARALARDLDARYATAKEFHDDLERALVAMGGATSEDVGSVLASVFAERRETTRAQIKEQLANLVRRPESDPDLVSVTQSRLPGEILLDLSDVVREQSSRNLVAPSTSTSLVPAATSSAAMISDHHQRPSRGRGALLALAGLTAIAVAASAMAVVRARAVRSAPTVHASAPPPTLDPAPGGASVTSAPSAPPPAGSVTVAAALIPAPSPFPSLSPSASAASPIAPPVVAPRAPFVPRVRPEPAPTKATPSTPVEPRPTPKPSDSARVFRRDL